MHEAMLQEILIEVQGYCHHDSPASVLDIYSKEMLFWALDGMLSRERVLKQALSYRSASGVQELEEALRWIANRHSSEDLLTSLESPRRCHVEVAYDCVIRARAALRK